ncbi:hypothetical protein FDA94_04000 [Herbidospora galbida]|uniref:Uncharacterized protein n=1 Tax=Herbidospora galbida TaxID=2575442 RepID=A0A4U3MRC2_9ACTN|nr:hypothetical protein [Herbidospora galbida]TKK90927.1 hypothetical protein FDA94_04000 [Herbidospora galbida]
MGIATAGALIVFPGTSQGSAEGPYYFKCVGPLADGQTIAASISLSSKELTVGQQLVINWQLGDAQRSVKVPDPLNPNHDKGGHLAVTARVKAHGVWTGQGAIDSTGTRLVEEGDLRTGKPLSLGLVSPGLATAERAGSGSIEVGPIILDLAPVESTWNNTFVEPVGDFGVAYDGNWSYLADNNSYLGETHFNHDLHQASKEDAEASFTFVGTGVDLIGDKASDMSEFTLVTDQGNPPDEASERYNAYWSVAGERRVRETFTAAKDLPYGKYTVKVNNKTEGKHARIDAWRVHASTADNLNKSPYHTVCSPEPKFPLIPLTVTGGGNGSPSPDPSGDPSQSPSGNPSVTPSTTPTTTPTTTPSGSATPSGNVSRPPTPQENFTPLVSVIVQGTPTPTATTTVTLTSTPTVAQVAITPLGGAQTGEAPDRSNPGAAVLVAGALLLMGGMVSGIKLLRRRAAHAGER